MNENLSLQLYGARQVIKDILTDTASDFATGDLVCAVAAGEAYGIHLNEAVTAVAMSVRIRQTLTGKGKGLGYSSLIFNQVATGASILYNGIEKHGAKQLLEMNDPDSLLTMQTAALFAFAIPALLLQSLKESGIMKAEGSQVKRIAMNPMTYASIAGIIATLDQPLVAAAFATALTSIVLDRQDVKESKPGEMNVPTPLWDELTPKKLLRDSYMLGAVPMALNHHPMLALAWLTWCTGFHNLPLESNEAPDIPITPENFLSAAVLADGQPLSSEAWGQGRSTPFADSIKQVPGNPNGSALSPFFFKESIGAANIDTDIGSADTESAPAEELEGSVAGKSAAENVFALS